MGTYFIGEASGSNLASQYTVVESIRSREACLSATSPERWSGKKYTIEGLSCSGDNYDEAVCYLKAKYDRPRQVHQVHVKNILDAPPIKEGTGKDIRKLHDTVLQHLRALKSMGYDPSGPFITPALELKLDQNTMFEWQRHSQKSVDVPHYQELLDFLNLHAHRILNYWRYPQEDKTWYSY